MAEPDQDLEDFLLRVSEQLGEKTADFKPMKIPDVRVKQMTVTVETQKEHRKEEKGKRSLLLKASLFGRKIRSGAHPTEFIPSIARSFGKLAGDEDGYTTAEFAKSAGINYSVWLDEDSHPILVYRDLTRMYGKDWLDWEPETLWQAIEEDEKITDLPRSAKDKVAALRVCVKTDFPWTELEVFENVAHAFVGREVRFDLMQQLEPYEVAFALDCMVDIQPGQDIGERVQSYIAATLFDAGLSYAPPVLFGPVQDDLDVLRRGSNSVRDSVEKAWKAGGSYEEGDVGKSPVATQLATLGAIKDFLKQRRAETELTPQLPKLDYDAEDDDGVPSTHQQPISAPARGEWLRRSYSGS
jgi:hypothetical protein